MQVVRRLGVDHQVDAGDLVLLLDPEAHRPVDHPGDAAPRPRTRRRARRAAAEQPACRAGRPRRRRAARRPPVGAAAVASRPMPIVPTRPPTRCTPTTSSESSYPKRYFRPTASAQTTPATTPDHQRAERGHRRRTHGVIATSPATTPEAAPSEVACPSRSRSSAASRASRLQPAQQRGHEDDGRGVVGAERRAGVEAEPAEPQQAGAEHDQGQVVRPHRVAAEADPAAEHQRQRERRGAGADLDRRPAGEVDGADLVGQPAADVARRGRSRRPSARPARRPARVQTATKTSQAPNRARSAIAPETSAPVITRTALEDRERG